MSTDNLTDEQAAAIMEEALSPEKPPRPRSVPPEAWITRTSDGQALMFLEPAQQAALTYILAAGKVTFEQRFGDMQVVVTSRPDCEMTGRIIARMTFREDGSGLDIRHEEYTMETVGGEVKGYCR